MCNVHNVDQVVPSSLKLCIFLSDMYMYLQQVISSLFRYNPEIPTLSTRLVRRIICNIAHFLNIGHVVYLIRWLYCQSNILVYVLHVTSQSRRVFETCSLFPLSFSVHVCTVCNKSNHLSYKILMN